MPCAGLAIGAGIAGYCAVHVLAYAVVVRHRRWARSERGIFAYHAGSFLVLSAAALVVAAHNPAPAAAVVVSAIATHGIYSLTFLELWSLTQGSYSLSILDAVDRAERGGTDPPWRRLEAIEETKRADRLAALRHLGLVRAQAGGESLTPAGRIVAALLSCIAWTARQPGDAP